MAFAPGADRLSLTGVCRFARRFVTLAASASSVTYSSGAVIQTFDVVVVVTAGLEMLCRGRRCTCNSGLATRGTLLTLNLLFTSITTHQIISKICRDAARL